MDWKEDPEGRQLDKRGLEFRVRGDSERNTLVLTGCIVQGNGGGGRDTLGFGSVEDRHCTRQNRKLYGYGGHDRLTGSRLRDVLVGGPGRDRANGRGGRDRCAAEVEVACELNP